MKLTVLGSGVAMPKEDRWPSGYLLEHKELKVLLDCSAAAYARLLQQKEDLHAIDAIVFTHPHLDHTGGLAPLIQARGNETSATPREISLAGPFDIRTFLDTMAQLTLTKSLKTYPTNCQTLTAESEPFSIGDLRFTPFVVPHIENHLCLGYRIEADGKTLVYTGDTGNDIPDASLQKMEGADVLIIEATEREAMTGHCTPAQAIKIGFRAHARRIFLTHMSPTNARLAAADTKSYGKNVSVATDGMIIEL